jgi:hypothetical protein
MGFSQFSWLIVLLLDKGVVTIGVHQLGFAP